MQNILTLLSHHLVCKAPQTASLSKRFVFEYCLVLRQNTSFSNNSSFAFILFLRHFFLPHQFCLFFFVLKPYLSFTFMFSKIFIIYIFYVFSTHTTTSLLIPHLFKNKRLRLRKYKERKTKYTNLHKYKTREEIFQIDCLCCSSNNNIYNKNNKKHFLVYHTYVCVVYTPM